MALLLACSGGAPAGGGAAGVDGSAGGDGAGGGAGGNAVAVGGPVGGGGGINPVSGAGASGAAGTVSLPAPGSMAIEPVEELLVMSIECANVRGPTVECRGLEGSAPAGASLRLSVHPPNNLGTINIGTALMVTVQPDGSWNSGPSHVIASAGQMIQVCLMKAGLCDESLFLTVPPEGGVVNGAQGIKKNMVVDSNGNIFYTQVVPRVWPQRVWSWRSLFFSEAYAIEPTPPLGDRRIVLTPEATRGLLGDRPFNLDLNPASVTQLAADCPPQPTELTPMVEATGSRLQGNRATIWMQNKFNIGFYPEKIAWIPNANREQIRDLAAMSWGRVGGGLDNYLAAAVANFVYLVRYTDGASYLETRVEFPKDFEVSQLINSGAYLYVLLTPKAGGPKPAYAVYRIYKAFDYTAHSYSGPLTAMCAPPSPALSSLKSIEQIDAWNGWIAGVGFTDTGKYRLFVGSPEIMDDLIDFPPVTLKEYDHPVEVKILKRDYSGIGLAVLDPVEKKLTTIAYKWATAPETAEFRETPLTGLNLNYPRTLSVDFDNAKLAFLDIAESGTRVYEYTFSGSGHDFRVSRAVPAVFFIGPQAPNTLRSVAGVWNYNDAMGSMREVETTPAYLEIDLNSEELQRGVRMPPGGAGGARVLPLR